VEPEICTKLPKKLSEKLRAKLPVSMVLSQNVLNWKQANRRSITAAKRKEKEKKERGKKKIEKPKDAVHLFIKKKLLRSAFVIYL